MEVPVTVQKIASMCPWFLRIDNCNALEIALIAVSSDKLMEFVEKAHKDNHADKMATTSRFIHPNSIKVHVIPPKFTKTI